MGRDTHLSSDIENKIRAKLIPVYKKSSFGVPNKTVLNVAYRIIRKHVPHLLNEISLTKGWAQYFKKRTGLLKTRGKYEKQIRNDLPLENDFDIEVDKFRQSIRSYADKFNTPDELFCNMDEVQLSLEPGKSQSDKNNHITLVIGVTKSGVLLPLQIITITRTREKSV